MVGRRRIVIVFIFLVCPSFAKDEATVRFMSLCDNCNWIELNNLSGESVEIPLKYQYFSKAYKLNIENTWEISRKGGDKLSLNKWTPDERYIIFIYEEGNFQYMEVQENTSKSLCLINTTKLNFHCELNESNSLSLEKQNYQWSTLRHSTSILLNSFMTLTGKEITLYKKELSLNQSAKNYLIFQVPPRIGSVRLNLIHIKDFSPP